MFYICAFVICYMFNIVYVIVHVLQCLLVLNLLHCLHVVTVYMFSICYNSFIVCCFTLLTCFTLFTCLTCVLRFLFSICLSFFKLSKLFSTLCAPRKQNQKCPRARRAKRAMSAFVVLPKPYCRMVNF